MLNCPIFDSTVEHFCVHCPALKHLDLYQCNYVTNAVVDSLATNAHDLKSFRVESNLNILNRIDISLYKLYFLAKRCTHLQSFSLTSYCQKSPSWFTTNRLILEKLNVEFPHLEIDF